MLVDALGKALDDGEQSAGGATADLLARVAPRVATGVPERDGQRIA